MVSTPSSARESTAGLGVRKHATYLWQGKTSETGRDYGHHLDNHERDVCGKMLISDACAHGGCYCNGRRRSGLRSLPTGTLGRCSNTQLMTALLF
jgi:hypothetical protein